MKTLKYTTGLVTSSKMDKSIVVVVETKYKHPVYKKTLKRSKKFIVHDEKNQYKVGDTVEITTCRPLSKRKCHRIVKKRDL